jgi:hypothetical protein
MIVLDEVEPPAGRVSTDDDEPVAFCGWLGLLRTLERATASRSAHLAPQRLRDELDA